jgi:hypothetical protein
VSESNALQFTLIGKNWKQVLSYRGFVGSDENDLPENDPPVEIRREIHGRAQPASPPSLEILRSLKALKGENSYRSHGSSLTSA